MMEIAQGVEPVKTGSESRLSLLMALFPFWMVIAHLSVALTIGWQKQYLLHTV